MTKKKKKKRISVSLEMYVTQCLVLALIAQ